MCVLLTQIVVTSIIQSQIYREQSQSGSNSHINMSHDTEQTQCSEVLTRTLVIRRLLSGKHHLLTVTAYMSRDYHYSRLSL